MSSMAQDLSRAWDFGTVTAHLLQGNGNSQGAWRFLMTKQHEAQRKRGFPGRIGMISATAAAGVFLAGYVVFLLTANYFSQLELRETALTRLRYDMEKRAMAASYFFAERREDIADLATRRGMSIYFENLALGMSREYGLEAGLSNIDEFFDRLRERKRLGEERIYSRIVFIDSRGELLVDSRPEEVDPPKGETAKPGEARNWQDLLTPREIEPSILTEHFAEGYRVVISAPYFLKGKYEGQIVAWVPPRVVSEYLLEVMNRHYSKQFVGLTCGSSYLLPPPRMEFAVYDLPEEGDTPHRFSIVNEVGVAEEMLSLRVPVRNTPFSLVTILPASEVLGHAAPWHLLLAMGALAVVVLGGTAVLVRVLFKSNERLKREVDERKQVEEALRQSEDKYRTIFETTGTAMVLLEEDMTVALANTKCEELWGCEKAEIEGARDWRSFIVREDLERMGSYHRLRRTDPDAVPKNYEARFVDRRGREKDVIVCVAMIPQTKRSVASFLDISERKEAEAALRMSEARFRSLVENSLTGICILQDGRVVYHNPEQERLLGSGAVEDWRGDFRTVHIEDVEKVRRLHESVFSGENRTADVDFRFYPGGEKEAGARWATCRASLIEYQGRNALLVNMMDITRIKELEQMVRIEDRMSSLGRVATGIAHELRNPLSGLNIYVTNLERALQDFWGAEPHAMLKVEGLIESIKSISDKIERVVKGVMDFARPSVPRLVPADLNRAIEAAIDLSAATSRKSGISLEKFLAADLPRCYADPQLIEQVVLNLITNSIQVLKETDGPKKIEITSWAADNRILITVSDSGPGVPSYLRERIFDPFFTTQKDGGGIGLSLCHRIVSDHFGLLRISESRWGGAEFAIEIPIEKRRRT